eukprot:g4262.t1
MRSFSRFRGRMNYQVAVVCLVLLFAGVHASGCTGEAHYFIQSDCVWTEDKFPTDYPPHPNFLTMSGVMHNEHYTLFRPGELASDGIKQLAEDGESTILEAEYINCQNAGNCKSGAEGYFTDVCDNTGSDLVDNYVCQNDVLIKVTPEHHYVSFAFKLSPSPDWFIGLHDINLCGTNSETGDPEWLDRYPPEGTFVTVVPFDAGTDSGTTFLSPNAPTSPHEPISEFIARDASNIFYNQEEEALYACCLFDIYRTRIF